MKTSPLLVALALAFSSLACGNDSVGVADRPSFVCGEIGRRPVAEDVPCGDGERFVQGECAPIRCDAGDAGCCPGTFCTGGGVCQIPASRVTTCQDDGFCATDVGERCLTRRRVDGESRTCGFPPVADDGTCTGTSKPFNGRCVRLAPCGGGCAAGQVCNVDLNFCEPAPEFGSCQASCDVDEVLVYADPDTMIFEQCCAVDCQCEPIPGLPEGAVGRFSDSEWVGDELLVSAYDEVYGDLVLSRFSAHDGSLAAQEYVDGVPASGPIVANPNGIRGGTDEAGADVGQHTSLAIVNGQPWIVYLDIDNASLSLARRSADGSWSLSTIDDGSDWGDQPIGGYSSLAIDSAGIAHVSYFVSRIDAAGVEVSSPIYARALSSAPHGVTDWERALIEPVPSCRGLCADDETCVRDSGGEATCAATRSDCSSPCACGMSCVDVAAAATCAETLPADLRDRCERSCSDTEACVSLLGIGSTCLPLDSDGCGDCGPGATCVDIDGNSECRGLGAPPVGGVPVGNGLFTTLLIDNGTPVVSFHDSSRGQLRVARAAFGASDPIGSFAAEPVACENGKSRGLHAAMISTTAGFAIVFQEGDGDALLLYESEDFSSGTLTVLDDGTRDGGSVRLVGAGAEAAQLGEKLVVIYADQTNNDLISVVRNGSELTRGPVFSAGAFGNSPTLAVQGAELRVSDYQRDRDPVTGGNTSGLRVTPLQP